LACLLLEKKFGSSPLREICVFHIDTYKEGIFVHDPKIHSKPEVCFEDLSDATPSQGVDTSNIKGGIGKKNKKGKDSHRNSWKAGKKSSRPCLI
jgi:hypothetical protein